MSNKMKTALDGVLQQCAGRFGGAPGVVAMATDRNSNITKARPVCANWARTRP